MFGVTSLQKIHSHSWYCGFVASDLMLLLLSTLPVCTFLFAPKMIEDGAKL